jgi:hypothetical protein
MSGLHVNAAIRIYWCWPYRAYEPGLGLSLIQQKTKSRRFDGRPGPIEKSRGIAIGRSRDDLSWTESWMEGNRRHAISSLQSPVAALTFLKAAKEGKPIAMKILKT